MHRFVCCPHQFLRAEQHNTWSSKAEPEPWCEFDMVPSQIEFPTQKIAVEITIIDPAIW